MRLIFDSHALLKFFQQEPGAARVERWLRIVQRRRWVKYLCAINLGEIIAAELKATYGISYADCFVLACAIQHAASIVTGDPEFNKASHLAKIHWI
jgi:predicted nucleic acid-binding protein